MKKKKGFERKEVLIISPHEVGGKFLDLFYEGCRAGLFGHGLSEYISEFTPSSKQDYSQTLTQENLEEYWKDQTMDNDFKGTLEEFIKDYGLEMDVWLINCGYDFTGVKTIVIDGG